MRVRRGLNLREFYLRLVDYSYFGPHEIRSSTVPQEQMYHDSRFLLPQKSGKSLEGAYFKTKDIYRLCTASNVLA